MNYWRTFRIVKFILLEICLLGGDVVTDGKQAYDHFWWVLLFTLKMASGETICQSYECSPHLSLFVCVKNDSSKEEFFSKKSEAFNIWAIIILVVLFEWWIHLLNIH